MTRRIIGPFNRVEGDLEITLDIDGGVVREARVNASLYRGFEQILLGRPALDAISITPRICGICSVSQSVATVAALADAFAIKPAPNGQLGINLIHGAENLADHLTHFYLFFMPDFARPVYSNKPWFAEVERRFAAKTGLGAQAWLVARARLLHVTGILAGKWPHTLAVQPGGLTHAPDDGELMHLRSILADVRDFLQNTVFGTTLERIVELDRRPALDDAIEASLAAAGDFGLFGAVARDLSLENLGLGYDRFMSFGAYHGEGGALFAPGIMDGGAPLALDPNVFSEDPSHAWLMGDVAHPLDGETLPYADRVDAYTWCKAPRVEGRPVEVGAVARQLIADQPLIRDLIGKGPANVFARVIARLLESARIVLAMEDWAARLQAHASVCVETGGADQTSGIGVGLVEAARGSLGHWLRVENGLIQHYQIIAPTTWNFSPRDKHGQPGPLEFALQNTPVDDDEPTPASVQHVVRSFDPCMVCTVH
ncbi:nickel-dependent hydrogenase large subunit [Magnetovibrio sp.]|uniref:nickel-dependent hydrogenase large subunit n=1 Tax=Magnetovibrio sp. TaxID=2024836 RepID=UPI002F93A245